MINWFIKQLKAHFLYVCVPNINLIIKKFGECFNCDATVIEEKDDYVLIEVKFDEDIMTFKFSIEGIFYIKIIDIDVL